VAKKKLISRIRDVDDMVNLLTGKRIHNLVARAIDLFGNELGNDNGEQSAEAVLKQLNSPYRVLGVREDADDLVVKASYRSLMKKYHPDSGTAPDNDKASKINDSYAEICKLRGIGK